MLLVNSERIKEDQEESYPLNRGTTKGQTVKLKDGIGQARVRQKTSGRISDSMTFTAKISPKKKRKKILWGPQSLTGDRDVDKCEMPKRAPRKGLLEGVGEADIPRSSYKKENVLGLTLIEEKALGRSLL